MVEVDVRDSAPTPYLPVLQRPPWAVRVTTTREPMRSGGRSDLTPRQAFKANHFPGRVLVRKPLVMQSDFAAERGARRGSFSRQAAARATRYVHHASAARPDTPLIPTPVVVPFFRSSSCGRSSSS